MASVSLTLRRGISTSSVCHSKKNFRQFLCYNKRANRALKEEQRTNPRCDIPIDHRGVRPTGYYNEDKWVQVPEMIPELIVPSLKDFPLKPYVSYKASNTTQPKFTAKDLFNAVYLPKIKHDFVNDGLGPNGEPLKPSPEETLTPEEARNRAGKTGTDIFSE